MLDQISPWLGDIHKVLAPHWSGILCTVAACMCGAAIGFERQHARKPTGMRTLILICLGAAIFTQASILIANAYGGDRTRIAAQIVTGIGFLGAGAIMREGGLLIGVTTGAGIWATAAVGVVLGGGYIAAGLFFTILIVTTLALSGFFDRLVMGRCRMAVLRLTLDPRDGRTHLKIQSVLETFPHPIKSSIADDAAGKQTMQIDYCLRHLDHRAFVGEIIDLPGVLSAVIEES